MYSLLAEGEELLPAPMDPVLLEEDFEKIRLSWTYQEIENLAGFRIYRSEDKGMSYLPEYEENFYLDSFSTTNYYCYVEAPLDPATGNNGSYTYKIVPVDKEGKEGKAVTIENKGGSVGTDSPDTVVAGIAFVDENGNSIDKLSLHVGEAKKIGLALVKEDGSIASLVFDSYLKEFHSWAEYWDVGYQFSIEWKLRVTTGEVSERNLDFVDYDTSDIDWLFTKEVIDAKEGYFRAVRMPETGEKYFIEAKVQGPFDGTEYYRVRLPIQVEEAETGATYEQPETLQVVNDQSAVEQGLRDFMVNRKEDSWVISEDITDLDSNVLLDLFEEREGMKPWEGDYLKYTIGERDHYVSVYSDIIYGYFSYKNESYRSYAYGMPFITTAEEEQQVSERIQELIHTEGGDLYPYAHGENVTDEEKIQAIYNWITKNVSGTVPGDRRTPIYHTAYHALIKKSGTCGAFAVLFTRFSREMGIPSKVIMGVDVAAHAYNVVQVGRKWMYIDTSAKKYLADAGSFSRADEQEHYKNPLFIKNYLSKVPGSPYVEDAEGVAVVTSSVDSVGESFEKLKDAMGYIVEQVESGEDPDVTYTITLTNGDMYFPTDGMMFYGENMLSYGGRVSIDLGGNMLRIMDGVNPATLMVKKVSNGTIGVGNSASFRIFAPMDMGEVTYEDLDIVYYSKVNISNPTPMLWILAEGESKVTLKNSVTIEKFYSIFLEGNVEVNCELQAEEMELGGEIYPDAVVRLNKKVTAEESLKIWCGTIYAETLISKKKLELQDPSNTFLFIGKELKVSGSTILQDIFDNTQVTVSLEQAVQEGKENPVPKAALDWEGTIERWGGDGTISPMIALCAHYEEEGEEIKARGFHGGDILGRISLKAQNPVTYKYDTIISSDNYDDYLDIEIEQPEKYFAEIENQTLSIVGLSISVQQGEEGTTQKFSSLKKAIEGLSKVAGGASGTYIFRFMENTVLSANMTLPDYVKEAVFEKQEGVDTENIEIDMKGYSLTSKGSFTVKEGVLLNSTGSGNGSFITNKVSSENDYGIRLYAPIEKVNLKAVNAAVWLEENQNIQIISGEVTAKNLVTEGDWKITGKVTNTSIENLGTLVLDTVIQASKNKTVLNENSKLVVLTRADLYHVEVKQPVSGTKPVIYREENAELSMNGNFLIEEKGLGFGILSKDDDKDGTLYNDVVDVTSKQKLFTTSSKSFPILSIDLKQASADPKYTVLLQKGTEILAAGEWFVLKEVADGQELPLRSFADWKTVTEYITSLADSSAVYVIEIMDHIVLEEKLTLPTKAAKIILRGASSEELTKLTYLDDLQLTANLEIENLDLEAEKYNSKTKTKEPYFSAVKLSGKNLTMRNSTAEFSSITGTNISHFEIEGKKTQEVIVRKAIKTLQEIRIEGANLKVGQELKSTEAAVSAVTDVSLTEGKLAAESGTVTLTGTLTMKDGILEGSSKLELNHIISNSNQNQIIYGGNTKTDGCTIKGQISSAVDQGQQENQIYRKNAIDLVVKSLEQSQGYQQGQLLLTGPKVQGSWFVVGTGFEEGERKVEFAAYKEGTSIYCGTAEEIGAVLLAYDSGSGAYVTYDSYPTLQKALDEITQIADKTVNYRIVLTKDSVGNTMLTTPAYANSLQLSGKDPGTKLHVDKGITLKGTLVLEGLILVPGTKASLTLGDYSLRMTGCETEGNYFSGISGSGTKKASVLELRDTELYAAGAVKGIGTLILDDAGLTAEQDLTMGNLLQTEGKTGSLTATASVTRKNNEITKISPKITIEGYAVLEGDGIEVTLRELSGKLYQILDLKEGAETAAIREAGVPFIKGAYLSTDRFTLSAKCVGDETGKGITKKSGHLVYDPVEKTGALLIYRDQNNTEIRTKVGGLKEAVEEIDSQKIKRDYTILLSEGAGESLALEKTLPMPKSNSMSSLILEGDFGAEDSWEELLQLPLNGGITLTAPTTFKNLSFVKKDAEDYPAATALTMGGNDLTIEGKVVMNTPLTINGGSKGSLIFGEDGQLVTLTNKTSFPQGNQEQLIHGTIAGIKRLELKEGQRFILKDYQTISGTKTSSTPAALTVAELYSKGEVKVQGEGAKQKVKIDSAVLTGGSLSSSGSIEMNELRLSGETSVRAKTDFTIKKTLYSDTKDGALYTSIKEGKTPAPYLKIDGNVILEKEGEHKVKIGVYEDTSSEKLADLLENTNTGQLLTASKVGIGAFTAVEGNVNDLGEYSVKNPTGYLLKKSGSGIYVCGSENAAAALCMEERSEGDLSEATATYYTDIKAIVEEINNRKNKEETYTIILLKDVNSSTVPAAMTLPSMAKKVIITSLQGEQYGWYYTGNVSLKTETEFNNIIFYPMKSSEKPTLSSFTTGTYHLTLRNIFVGEMEGMGFKDISGNAKQTTILGSDGIRFSGNVQNSGTLILEKPAVIEGKVKASLVILESGTKEQKNTATVTGSFQADRLTMRGNTELVGKNTITITNLGNEKGEDSSGNGENRISYGTNQKGGGQLTLKGMVEGHNDTSISLSMTAANKTSEDYRIIQDPKTLKYQTSDNKKLAVFEKEDPSKTTILLNGQALDSNKITVISKGVYLLP